MNRWFVTGHTGFKGTWLTLYLAHLGIETHGYSIDTRPFFVSSTRSLRRASYDRQGDICDLSGVAAAMKATKPDVVVHLAAESIVRRAARHPVRTWQTNVQGTVNVLEAARRTPSIRAVLVVTSDKCYANSGVSRPMNEDHPLGGADPYSASKAAAEHAVEAYRNTYFRDVSVATARAGNVVGWGDSGEDRLIPDCLRAIRRGRPIPLRHPDAIRPWQHVIDVIHGYRLLIDAQLRDPAGFSEAFNFGPPPRPALAVHEVAELVIQSQGRGSWEHVADPKGVTETKILRLDSSKVRVRLGWKPRFTSADAVRRAVTEGDPARTIAEYLA
ncbi:MAG: CDP-glucose 4,6-dehydratase [Gemmataceae bacterium]|nr:CDP-glucose 4,6-dehydratase [Gemmataceae bacterium]